MSLLLLALLKARILDEVPPVGIPNWIISYWYAWNTHTHTHTHIHILRYKTENRKEWKQTERGGNWRDICRNYCIEKPYFLLFGHNCNDNVYDYRYFYCISLRWVGHKDKQLGERMSFSCLGIWVGLVHPRNNKNKSEAQSEFEFSKMFCS